MPRMRIWISMMVVLGLFAAAPGCGKKDKDKDKPKVTAPPVKPPEPEKPPEKPPEPKPEEQEGRNKMANCPSAATGAETKITKGKDAVMVSVTAKDPAAIKDIQERAKKVVEAAKAADSGEIKHTGMGTGGGSLGECPVVLEGTTIEAKDSKTGVTMTVKPADAKGLDDLLKKSQDRLAAMAKAAPPADAPKTP
jgi:hypothetical protein